MIKLENVVLASPKQMEFIIEGMRNPMNSWDRSDSYIDAPNKNCNGQSGDSFHVLGENDHSLMQRLADAGSVHRKYMRMMPVYVRITAPLYWWKEFDTYKVGTVANSCSTMHKIQEKEFTLEDFSTEHLLSGWCDKITQGNDIIYPGPAENLENTILVLNRVRESYLSAVKNPDKYTITPKDIWWQMIQLLPSSYNQTRNVMMNYEVLANIYRWRKDHKLDEWREFCKWIEGLPYNELITGLSDKLVGSGTGENVSLNHSLG